MNNLDQLFNDVITSQIEQQQYRETKTLLEKKCPVKIPVFPIKIREWITSIAFRAVIKNFLILSSALGIILFSVIVIPRYVKYDSIVDLRLHDDYRNEPIMDMANNDRYVYLATNGNGLQRYDVKKNSWRTYKQQQSNQHLNDTMRQVVYDSLQQRLWFLTGNKNVVTVPANMNKNKFITPLKTGSTWFSIKYGDITQARVIDNYLYFGTSNRGASIYNMSDHSWTILKDASPRVQQMFIDNDKIWIGGNTGVHVYNRLNGNKNEKYCLPVPNIKFFGVSASLSTAVDRENSLYLFHNNKWGLPYGGGIGLAGISQWNIKRALFHKNSLFLAVDNLGLARYNLSNRRWQVLGNNYHYKQMTFLGDHLFATDLNGIRIFSFNDSLKYDQCLHPGENINLLNNDTTRLFYENNQGELYCLDTHNYYKDNRLIQSPDSLMYPHDLHHVLVDSNFIWLATSTDGLLRYDPAQHYLHKGNFSSYQSWPFCPDQLFKKNKGFIARAGDKVFSYQGTGWFPTPGNHRVKKIIKNSQDKFFFLTHDGYLVTEDEQVFFGGRMLDTRKNYYIGEIHPNHNEAYFVLPENKIVKYELSNQSWQTVAISSPSERELLHFHWSDSVYTWVTKDQKLCFNGVPYFQHDTIPAPLNKAVDFIEINKNQPDLLIAWPKQLGVYSPNTGDWQKSNIQINEYDQVKDLIEWNSLILVKTQENKLLMNSGGTNFQMDDSWNQIGFSKENVKKLEFGEKAVWSHFNKGTIGRWIPAFNETSLYFDNYFPDLEKAKFFIKGDENTIWAVFDNRVGHYNTINHNWCHFTYLFCESPNDSIRQVSHYNGKLYVLTRYKIIVFHYQSSDKTINVEKVILPTIPPHSFIFCNGNFSALLKQDNNLFILSLNNSNNQSRQIFFDQHYSGNLDDVIWTKEYSNELWVLDKNGIIGKYNAEKHSWKHHALPKYEKPIRFFELFDHVFIESQSRQEKNIYYCDLDLSVINKLPITFSNGRLFYYSNTNEFLFIDSTKSLYFIQMIDQRYIAKSSPHNQEYYCIDIFKHPDNQFSYLLENKNNHKKIIAYKNQFIPIDEDIKLSGIKNLVEGAEKRLWILGKDKKLYVGRLEPIKIDSSIHSDHFERKLNLWKCIMDFPSELHFSDQANIEQITVSKTTPDLWICANNKISHYLISMNSPIPQKLETIPIPYKNHSIEKLEFSMDSLVIVQKNERFEIRTRKNIWNYILNIFKNYNYTNWEKIGGDLSNSNERYELPKNITPLVEKGKGNWHVFRDQTQTINFGYRLMDQKYKILKHDGHKFLKDCIIDLISIKENNLFTATLDGLIGYNFQDLSEFTEYVSKDKIIFYLMKTQAPNFPFFIYFFHYQLPINTIDKLLTKNEELWAIQNKSLKQIKIKKNKYEFKDVDYSYAVECVANDQIIWWQKSPNSTEITVKNSSGIRNNKVVSDSIIDIAAMDSVICLSSPAGIWWGLEKGGVQNINFSSEIPAVKFRRDVKNRLIACTPKGYFILDGLKWKKKTQVKFSIPTTKFILGINGIIYSLNEGTNGLNITISNSTRRVENNIFADDIVNDAIFFNDVLWIASQGGIWIYNPDTKNVQKDNIAFPDHSFKYFIRNKNSLYVVDSFNNIYKLEKSWNRKNGTTLAQLDKTVSNGRIKFTESNNHIRLDRVSGRGPVWINDALIGDYINEAEIDHNTLWTFAPEIGIVNYPQLNFRQGKVIDNIFIRSLPAEMKFFFHPDSQMLYMNASTQNWKSKNNRFLADNGKIWSQSYTEAQFEKLEWYRDYPGCKTVKMRINNIDAPQVFQNNRLIFDTFSTVYSDNKDSLFIGNQFGLFIFHLASFSKLKIIDYIPCKYGIEQINRHDDEIYIKTNNNEIMALNNRRFIPAHRQNIFNTPVPVISYRDQNIIIENQLEDIYPYTASCYFNFDPRVPIFAQNGTFTFDNFQGAISVSDTVWIGVTSFGIVENSLNKQAKFYALYDNFSDIQTIKSIKQQGNNTYLHINTKWGDTKFFKWNQNNARLYDEFNEQLFNHPKVIFTPYSAQWTEKNVPYFDSEVLAVNSDIDYPLFIPDLHDSTKARFAFDDIQSMTVKDNVLWIGSRGGLLRYRFTEGEDNSENKLLFEAIYTPQDQMSSFHVAKVQKGIKHNSIDLLEINGNDKFKQTMLLGAWQDTVIKNDNNRGNRFFHSNLYTESDLIDFQTRICVAPLNRPIFDGYKLQNPLGRVIRSNKYVFFIAKDTLICRYKIDDNIYEIIRSCYLANSNHKKSIGTLNPPFSLVMHNNQPILIDGNINIYSFLPNQPIDTLSVVNKSGIMPIASLNTLNFINVDNHLIVKSDEIPEFVVKANDKNYAFIFKNGKLFIYDDKNKFNILEYDFNLKKYKLYSNDNIPSYFYNVKPNDGLYKVLKEQGIADWKKDGIVLKWAENLVLQWNSNNIERREKWLKRNTTIRLPQKEYAPPDWLPDKYGFYWHDKRNKLIYGKKVEDLLIDQIYLEDNTCSIIWTGKKFVNINRERKLCEQYLPPEQFDFCSYRRIQDDLILVPKIEDENMIQCYKRIDHKLTSWEDPGWDPFLEKRVQTIEGDDSVLYSYGKDHLLLRNGKMIKRSTDLYQPKRIYDVINIKQSRKKIWVATQNNLFMVHP